MVFSKLYLSVYAGAAVKAEQSSFFSVNPSQIPGSALFAGSCAERAALGGQVAARLALQHFLVGIEESLSAIESSNDSLVSDTSSTVMESGFRTANSAVYDFGHKLSAGGRMAASLVSVFIRDGLISAGRVGKAVAYLGRGGEVFPFFSSKPLDQEILTIGSNSVVSVELASVTAEAGDVVLVFSDPVPPEEESDLGHIASLLLPKFDIMDDETSGAERFAKRIDRLKVEACERLTQQVFGNNRLPAFSCIMAIGPDVNYLSPKWQLDSDLPLDRKGI